ncbi:galactarate dehydratase [Marinomonas sp. CT5]|uniref:galactarate dehydratase n=1 Tax=Marinomonas sp. CT5 TaxID=2066133 RepID=UPI001BAFC3E4|nr:galactarate dehydratase [Marinomonas sp. CT5]QUX94552.1 galactarate dehydratase [Marinomonas sp. CT5]
MDSSYSLIKVNDNDNVAIVANPNGIPKGAILPSGLVFQEQVPQGHKVSLVDISKGEEVIRYNEVIGYAVEHIGQGCWVHERKLSLPAPPRLENLPLGTRPKLDVEALEGYTFDGYRNADGSVGTKNLLGISSSVQCVSGVIDFAVKKIKSELLPKYPNVDGVVALNHTYGCGIDLTSPDSAIPIRTLKNLSKNPNFGGEVLVVGLGCEQLQPSRLMEVSDTQVLDIMQDSQNPSPKNEVLVNLQDECHSSFEDMVNHIMHSADNHLKKLNQRSREECPISDLVLGVQCGGSDSFSGITANPVVGYVSDLIVRAGGSVMFSEVTEVRDAIHLLTPRVANESVGKRLLEEMTWYDNYLNRGNTDRSANPTPGNKNGGLSNVVEKALGSIAKSGTSQIMGVIGPGEKIEQKGLNFAATPASDFICGTLQAASGMTVQIFTTGRGTPYGLEAVPVIKVSSNSVLGSRWKDLIDMDAGRVASNEMTIEEAGWELFHLLLDVASGRKLVATDKLGLHNSLVLFNPTPVM